MPRQRQETLHNRPEVKDFRKNLRSNLTPAEAVLWKMLKKSNLSGRKFRRQHSVGHYVLDFYCPAERLAIELDGEYHFDALAQIHDMKRRRYLIDQGIKTLRFENKVVFEEPAYLLNLIEIAFGWWEK